ncbi:hypothetical protein D9M70_506300 [compost metagenome]
MAGRLPVGRVAAVKPREIEHEEIDRIAALHHGGKRGGLLLAVAPDEGVVVGRVGDRHHLAERILERLLLLFTQCPVVHPVALAGVRHQRGLAAGTAHRGDVVAVERAGHMQELQRFEKRWQRIDAADAEAGKQSRGDAVVAGK